MAYVPAPGEKDLEKINRSIRNAHERMTALTLDDLADVDAAAPTDGQLLTWDDANSEWVAGDAPSTGRELLTANRTYYVDGSSGDDGNDGLTAGAGAFATIQKAVNTAAELDLGIYDVTIDIANGTYTANVELKSLVGAGTVTLTGDTATPSNVTVSVTSDNAIDGSAVIGRYHIDGLKLTTATSGSCLVAFGPMYLTFASVEFGATAAAHIVAQGGSIVEATGNYSLTGGGLWSLFASEQGSIRIAGRTVTQTGTFSFSQAYAEANRLGMVRANSATFSGGTITGRRYIVSTNGVIFTSGGGASYFPGAVAGTTATGGQYA